MKTGAGDAVKSPVAGLRAGAIVKLNAAFLAFFFLVYMALLLHPNYSHILDRGASSLVRCTFRDACPSASQLPRKGGRSSASASANKAVVATERIVNAGRAPTMFSELRGRLRMGLVNIGRDELLALGVEGDAVAVGFDRVSDVFRWSDLFPEWIDEEEEDGVPSCPEIPMPDFSRYDDGEVDVVVAALPCNRTAPQGWNRDVFRLQVHLVAAQVAARKGRRDGGGRVRVVLRSACEPMMDLFRCDESVGREGDWWMYNVDAPRLEEKLRLPVGSCNLALPLWGPTGIHEVLNSSDQLTAVNAGNPRREAYATVLHSSDRYLCGAIVLAQSIRRSGSTRDMVLLHDHTVSKPALRALVAAGWIPRRIRRIRNPRAERGSYNEYNYSKFRLWQLTEYFRVVFIDADILVLRSLDALFRFPQISAVGNDGSLFNSGIMVIEPSACVRGAGPRAAHHPVLQRRRPGYLNEVFVWWHRLPRRVNYLKNFWANTTGRGRSRSGCSGRSRRRCGPSTTWGSSRGGATGTTTATGTSTTSGCTPATRRTGGGGRCTTRWGGDAGPCALSERRKIEIAWDRHVAQEIGYDDQHWKINITDPRKWE
ncbi:hypothetical protein ZWY2020_016903 [Hordeum vulgare]|nr:hypothetical protein ZWY2020_016903 [Hordeum vulgare]